MLPFAPFGVPGTSGLGSALPTAMPSAAAAWLAELRAQGLLPLADGEVADGEPAKVDGLDAGGLALEVDPPHPASVTARSGTRTTTAWRAIMIPPVRDGRNAVQVV